MRVTEARRPFRCGDMRIATRMNAGNDLAAQSRRHAESPRSHGEVSIKSTTKDTKEHEVMRRLRLLLVLFVAFVVNL